jgi:transcriptional regulator with XRE-family HTH domain
MRAAAKWVQPEHHKIVGAALAAARQRANMTQVELARRLGKPQSVVSRYENGRRRVDLIEFLLIVCALGADPVEIFAEIVSHCPDSRFLHR